MAYVIALAAMSPFLKMWLMFGVSFATLKQFGGDDGLIPMWIVTVAMSILIVVVLAKVFVA